MANDHHLSFPLRLPDTHREAFANLDTLTCRLANDLSRNCWTEATLDAIHNHTKTYAYTYFRALDHDHLTDREEHLPSRYKRCIWEKVGRALRGQAERRAAFQEIHGQLPDHKLKRIHTRWLEQELHDRGEYLPTGWVDQLITQLNSYYDVHGRWPDTYLDLQDPPEFGDGTLPYAADDGRQDGQVIKEYGYTEDGSFTLKIKTPDTPMPSSRGDWSWHEVSLDDYDAFQELLDYGELNAPEFQPSRRCNGDRYYELQFSVSIDSPDATSMETEGETSVLAIDGGVRKTATAVVVTENSVQDSRPHFVRLPENEQARMRRLHRERTHLNAKLGHLRRNGRDHTDQFTRVHAEYERVNNKLRQKREQLVHDIANQLLALALVYDVDAIIHEDLRSYTPPSGEGELSWALSSWARSEIIRKVEYRAALAGIDVERVWPADSSKACPRCGSQGKTTKSPDHAQYDPHGAFFTCENARCDCQGDRDYIGALNVARVFFSEDESVWTRFTVSYTGASDLVSARRSVDTRPHAHCPSGVKSYSVRGRWEVQATAGGGSAYTAPAVAPSKTVNDSSSRSGPATLSESSSGALPTTT